MRTPSQGLLTRPTTAQLIRRAELQAVGAAEPEQLMRLDAAAVTRAGMIGLFFSRLGPARFVEYLRANEARFAELRIDGLARGLWTRCMLAAAAATFATLRATNGQESPSLNTVTERLQVLCRALQSVSGTSAPPGHFQQALVSLAEARNDQGVPFLIDAAKHGDHRAINGWADVLHSLGILEHIKDKLRFLLDAKRNPKDVSAMAEAGSGGHALAITALGNVFRSPRILEHIKNDLPTMLMGFDREGKPIGYAAVTRDDPAVIEAWCAVVLSPEILPHVKKHLPYMLANMYAGISAMAAAALSNTVQAMRALGDAIRLAVPHLRRATPFHESPLHHLVEAPCNGRSSLLAAVEAGYAGVISAWGDLVLSDEVLPRVRKKLPKMFRGSNVGGESALRVAALRGRPQSIEALGDLFLSPRALPHLRGHLLNLLTDVSDGGESVIELSLSRSLKNSRSYGPPRNEGARCFRAYLDVIEKAAPVLKRAEIKAILSPCRAVFAEVPADEAPRHECLQMFRASGMRIVDASRGALKRTDVLAISRPRRSD
jgi:hypothetical protein